MESSGWLDAVAPQVVQVEGSQLIGDLIPTGIRDVVDMRADRRHVRLRLLQLSGGGLRNRQQLHQAPEEADVEVALCTAHCEVVQLLRRESLQTILVGHANYPMRSEELCALPPAPGRVETLGPP